MLELASSPLLTDIATNLVVSLIVFVIGFLIGKWRGRRSLRGRNLEQYDFYPFTVDEDGFPQFSTRATTGSASCRTAASTSRTTGESYVSSARHSATWASRSSCTTL